ncbi:hypothetical protein E1218_06925 [Kribbella turkmenica]|uniref:Uncharacterized protein n=1 Tax=Kribbella turkmenica TaxID=2530375 RepID=A0A4R4XCX5_9ACTN|nr:hypothetical protein [Kribbella turkmenica]TDD28546.1 hypothetical protein E1218_06925 [Kribbella turkmenica]
MTATALDGSRLNRRRVRVWFGEHVIAQYVAEAPLAARYEQAMRRRFAGLRVTNDVLGAASPSPEARKT